MKWWQYMIAGAVAVVLLLVAFWVGSKVGQADPQTVIERDTVVVVRVDTITKERPVYVERRIVDTMLVAVTDTVTVRDSVFVEVAREQAVYRDSSYTAWVSGYRPSLDSIAIYQRTQYIYVTETDVQPDPIVSLGFTAGYGVALVPDGSGGTVVRPAPTVSAGININLITLFRKRKK
jgi:hypothetical protein